jgi:hypothetical protein
LNWTDFLDALQRNGALPSAGLTLFTVGATFHWFEQLCGFLGRRKWGPDPFTTTRIYVAGLRASGDEQNASRAEARIQDHQQRLRRYGRAMMLVGVAIVALSVLLA